MRPDISIVVPAYNEADNLEALATEIVEVLTEMGCEWELVLVDDGSSDATAEVLARLAPRYPWLRAFRLERNSGQSAALAAGFRLAHGAVIVTLDADLQNDPRDIPRLLAELDGCDVVSGVRAKRRDSWLRRVSSRIANRVRDAVVHDGVTDVGCSLKAYRAQVLARVPPFDGMHRFLPALVQMQGARVREIEVAHRPRRHGTSKYGVQNRLWRGLADLAGVWWLQKRWVGDRRPVPLVAEPRQVAAPVAVSATSDERDSVR